MIQTFLFEISNPGISSLDLINVSPDKLIPIIGLTDCHDVLDTLMKSTSPVLSNKSMVLYTAVLREFRENGRVSAWGWLDTRDNLANCLTKLESNGTLDIAPLISLMSCAAWEPSLPYRWGLQLCDPPKSNFAKLKPPQLKQAAHVDKEPIGAAPV